jgi:hypothetical protein
MFLIESCRGSPPKKTAPERTNERASDKFRAVEKLYVSLTSDTPHSVCSASLLSSAKGVCHQAPLLPTKHTPCRSTPRVDGVGGRHVALETSLYYVLNCMYVHILMRNRRPPGSNQSWAPRAKSQKLIVESPSPYIECPRPVVRDQYLSYFFLLSLASLSQSLSVVVPLIPSLKELYCAVTFVVYSLPGHTLPSLPNHHPLTVVRSRKNQDSRIIGHLETHRRTRTICLKHQQRVLRRFFIKNKLGLTRTYWLSNRVTLGTNTIACAAFHVPTRTAYREDCKPLGLPHYPDVRKHR